MCAVICFFQSSTCAASRSILFNKQRNANGQGDLLCLTKLYIRSLNCYIFWLFCGCNVVLREPAYWCNYSKPRMLLHSFVSSKYFDLANAGVIGLNVIMMALEYYLMPWVSDVVILWNLCTTSKNLDGAFEK